MSMAIAPPAMKKANDVTRYMIPICLWSVVRNNRSRYEPLTDSRAAYGRVAIGLGATAVTPASNTETLWWSSSGRRARETPIRRLRGIVALATDSRAHRLARSGRGRRVHPRGGARGPRRHRPAWPARPRSGGAPRTVERAGEAGSAGRAGARD